MFDIAMLLAAGLLGIQAKRAKKEEMQAASERLIMQHKQQQRKDHKQHAGKLGNANERKLL